jgi:hypothetical protein
LSQIQFIPVQLTTHCYIRGSSALGTGAVYPTAFAAMPAAEPKQSIAKSNTTEQAETDVLVEWEPGRKRLVEMLELAEFDVDELMAELDDLMAELNDGEFEF